MLNPVSSAGATIQLVPHILYASQCSGHFVAGPQHTNLVPHQLLQLGPHLAQRRLFSVGIGLAAYRAFKTVEMLLRGGIDQLRLRPRA